MKRLAITILIALFATPFAHAVTIKAMASCGKWISDREADGSVAITNAYWVMGFLSGQAVATGKEVLKGTDASSVMLWMDNYCRKNPLNDSGEAANTLFDELARRKGLQ
ncbi:MULTISPECIES: hypothetical protein [unclassified Variovorax]|uniref:hypothetical protein n=1 Tax=unclassified Variovorax TaxID=663243 RepID=UPI000F7FA661|nr:MULTISPECIES: hypothetical protein [unclassified Variovorax]RSZ47733.1 hypothetical protein EJO70_03800 [Variovorax sp. 553]RSZ48140.1 hypothetical protein EJO71_00185 [Variovorax sp. 679]